ncbi:MAG TPA: hypothetical protein VM221_05690 [Armatimonadota bacterium]|nr:hypothetical protein [Armatimonadota bacterium]
MTEIEIEEAVAEFLSRPGCLVERQVAFLRKVADVCSYDPVCDTLLAVEAKREDWRRGMQQARYYQLFADAVYIALPECRALRVRTPQLEETGIGLLVVNSTVSVSVEHGHNPFRRDLCREMVIERLRSGPRSGGGNR